MFLRPKAQSDHRRAVQSAPKTQVALQALQASRWHIAPTQGSHRASLAALSHLRTTPVRHTSGRIKDMLHLCACSSANRIGLCRQRRIPCHLSHRDGCRRRAQRLKTSQLRRDIKKTCTLGGDLNAHGRRAFRHRCNRIPVASRIKRMHPLIVPDMHVQSLRAQLVACLGGRGQFFCGQRQSEVVAFAPPRAVWRNH